MDRIFVDTGAWFALFNSGDPDHESVCRVLYEWDGRLLTSDYVFDELVTLIRFRVGHSAARRAGRLLRSEDLARSVSVEAGDRDSAWRRFEGEKDNKYSFTDGTSFSLMKRLNVTTTAVVDADFRRAGFQVFPEEELG